MPIYEFFCADCNTIFNFFSKSVNTTKTPKCPKCGKPKLKRQVSLFAETGKHGENSEGSPLDGLDESKMERAVDALASEAGKINENDPKQAAQLMRKFSSMTGIKFKGSMENALNRLEAGENPEQIEKDMGNLMDGDEDPFELPGKGAKGNASGKTRAPQRDTKLYDL
jgi:putative FmdB family regulatory protein